MKQEEIDSLLQVVENPVRRKIIKLLSQEPCYPLQLSKELGLGPPLVAKHLGVMEGVGLVASELEKSPNGPPRRRYSLAKSVSITMDVAPNLFIERGVTFEEGDSRRKKRAREGTEHLDSMVRDAARTTDDREKLSLLSGVLTDLDNRIGEIDSERLGLLRIRNQAMAEAATVACRLDGFERRRVMFHVLDEHDTRVETISESLNLRELAVKAILEELERDYF